ncbi:hypothetical protein CDAR_600391 [Caerostris darwini]|uniref:Uncharacterized protein n=1 Tax=Caerostris darwini TaxID=1538125 RepID=A0AAV4TWD7_9ARAC|nr:hypothetical protein CDAR_600391 [Caerostris darwini]
MVWGTSYTPKRERGAKPLLMYSTVLEEVLIHLNRGMLYYRVHLSTGVNSTEKLLSFYEWYSENVKCSFTPLSACWKLEPQVFRGVKSPFLFWPCCFMAVFVMGRG